LDRWGNRTGTGSGTERRGVERCSGGAPTVYALCFGQKVTSGAEENRKGSPGEPGTAGWHIAPTGGLPDDFPWLRKRRPG